MYNSPPVPLSNIFTRKACSDEASPTLSSTDTNHLTKLSECFALLLAKNRRFACAHIPRQRFRSVEYTCQRGRPGCRQKMVREEEPWPGIPQPTSRVSSGSGPLDAPRISRRSAVMPSSWCRRPRSITINCFTLPPPSHPFSLFSRAPALTPFITGRELGYGELR